MAEISRNLNPGRWLALPVVLTAAFMAILDVFIVKRLGAVAPGRPRRLAG